MRPQEIIDPSGEAFKFPPVIAPKFKPTPKYKILFCTCSQLASAKQRSPKVSQTCALKEKQGILVRDKYIIGDFAYIDQFAISSLD